ncbi:MAG: cytochrome c oxidase accessory protein CcoG [Pseudomonadota bacterium]
MSSQDTSGDDAPLYESRTQVFPKAVRGTFRTLKWWIMGVTLAIYYLTPWIRWDRGPELPDQAVLIDLAHRRFFFFWIEIWPQEFYYVAGLLIMAGLGLFLVTSIMGRAWCGYTCPQTVWVDLYQYVERWVDGDRNRQYRLWNQRWNAEKIRLRLTKWTIWLLIAVATGGAWIFYFADAPTLFIDLFTGQAHYIAYATVAVLTATTFVFGGFMREQVCIYMCPWPRIQGAMLDENSLIVTYKDWRGEPRGKHRKRQREAAAEASAFAGPRIGGAAPVIPQPGAPVLPTPQSRAEAGELGDCIDCNACVNVCPTGVDIREGQQIGCITCALCIDACDDIMKKIGKPRGLIDYCTLNDAEHEAAGGAPEPVWKKLVRPRTILYFLLWSSIGIGMTVALFMRHEVGLSVAPERNPVYVQLSGGEIRNTYNLKLQNMTDQTAPFTVGVKAGYHVVPELQGLDVLELEIAAQEQRRIKLFLTAPAWRARPERFEVRIWVENQVTRERTFYDTQFRGPADGIGP